MNNVNSVKNTNNNQNENGNLCLTRGDKESIFIGNNIQIKIVDANPNGKTFKARLIISAPKNIPIYRSEVIQKINPHFKPLIV